MSTHEVKVIEVKLEPHGNADALSIVKVGGYQVVVGTEFWKDGDLGAYIPPDSIVDTTRPEFEFLKREGRDKERIQVKRLRGVISMGCLVPAPAGSKVGDNVMEQLGVTHYEPEVHEGTGGEVDSPPPGIYAPKYDVENLRAYPRKFNVSEEIGATEKLHGSSSRYIYLTETNRIHVGGRNQWFKPEAKNIYNRALENTPHLKEWLMAHPGLVVYGEVYGPVQKLKYGKAIPTFAAFDILAGTRWLNVDEVNQIKGDLPWVPVLYTGPYDFALLEKLAEGRSTIPGADNIREGIVIRPIEERYDDEIGRVQLKLVSNEYLGKN